jgi:hypothetical protein
MQSQMVRGNIYIYIYIYIWGWGGWHQLGNRFVSFVRAYAWSGCRLECCLTRLGGLSTFPFYHGSLPLLPSESIMVSNEFQRAHWFLPVVVSSSDLQWYQVNQINSIEITWNQIKWNKMNSNEVTRNQMKSNETKWNHMKSDELTWNRRNLSEPKPNQMELTNDFNDVLMTRGRPLSLSLRATVLGQNEHPQKEGGAWRPWPGWPGLMRTRLTQACPTTFIYNVIWWVGH